MSKENFAQLALLDHAAGSVYCKDKKGIYRAGSLAFAQAVGHETMETIIGKDDRQLFSSLMPKEELDVVLENDRKVIETGITITCEEKAIDTFGQTAYYFTQKKALRDRDNNIIGIVGTSLDITDKKMSEHFLIEAVSNLQHDLKTPLINVQMILDTIKGQIKAADIREQLVFAQVSLQSLYHMCNIALESDFKLAQLHDGSMNAFCLHNLLKQVTDLFMHSATNKRITLNAETVGHFPNKLRGSETALRSALNNLVDNAIKFTARGFVSVTAEKLADNEGHCLVKFSVRDTGEGMSPEQQAYVFKKYAKKTPSEKTHTTEKSWGMGLYVAKRLVEKMGGAIQVQSKEGMGSQFFFIIPLYSV